ncbi:MAG TPA: GYD domain-containing protein [Candidatus Acidoferrales bacterium]|nr:GYD domain-containing protein [Candidatus Acidoferrales bacterium]
MPLFLSQVAYSEDGWQALVSNPQNRLEALRPVVDKLGGRIVNAYYAFGDYDVVLISEFPDNVSIAALAMAAAAGGAVRSIKTTPLLEAAEGVEALRKAAASGYRAPVGGRSASA